MLCLSLQQPLRCPLSVLLSSTLQGQGPQLQQVLRLVSVPVRVLAKLILVSSIIPPSLLKEEAVPAFYADTT